jgi:hypothetical protein
MYFSTLRSVKTYERIAEHIRKVISDIQVTDTVR